MPSNLARAEIIKERLLVGSSPVINHTTVMNILSMGFNGSDGKLIPHLKVE